MEAAARRVVSPADSIDEVKQLLQDFAFPAITDLPGFCTFLSDTMLVDKCTCAQALHSRFREQPNALCHDDENVKQLNTVTNEIGETVLKFLDPVFEDISLMCRSGKPCTVSEHRTMPWLKNLIKLAGPSQVRQSKTLAVEFWYSFCQFFPNRSIHSTLPRYTAHEMHTALDRGMAFRTFETTLPPVLRNIFWMHSTLFSW